MGMEENKTYDEWISELPVLTPCDVHRCCSQELTSTNRRKRTASLRERWQASRMAASVTPTTSHTLPLALHPLPSSLTRRLAHSASVTSSTKSHPPAQQTNHCHAQQQKSGAEHANNTDDLQKKEEVFMSKKGIDSTINRGSRDITRAREDNRYNIRHKRGVTTGGVSLEVFGAGWKGGGMPVSIIRDPLYNRHNQLEIQHLTQAWIGAQWDRPNLPARPEYTFPVEVTTPDVIPAPKPTSLNPRLLPLFHPSKQNRKMTYYIHEDWLSEKHPLDYLMKPASSNEPEKPRRTVTFVN